MIKLVFLDQNAWIYLLREREGKTDNPDIKKSLEAVIETSKNNKVIFPLSLVHLVETATKKNDKKRDTLIDFMFKISKGYAIIPYIRILKLEISQAINKQVGLPTINLRKIAVGRGLPFILGAKPSLVKKHKNASDLPKDLKQQLLSLVYSPDTLLWSMKKKEVIEQMRESRKIETEILQEFEKAREEDKKIVDNDLRFRVNAARVFINFITPEMAKISVERGLKKEEVMPKNMKRDDIENFFKSMPTIYTSTVLTYRRDALQERKIEKNDLNDIAALSIAIPYCDIVVTENMWTTIATQAKLDKIYDTVILSSVEKLHKYL